MTRRSMRDGNGSSSRVRPPTGSGGHGAPEGNDGVYQRTQSLNNANNRESNTQMPGAIY
jgi:hypothetical protein